MDNRRCDIRRAAHNFIAWRTEGAWTADGTVFDIGIATDAALCRLMNGCDPAAAGGRDIRDNGEKAAFMPGDLNTVAEHNCTVGNASKTKLHLALHRFRHKKILLIPEIAAVVPVRAAGEEIREAAHILRENKDKVNYKGFVEGFDIGAGTTQVVVSDGFSGNVALKSIEGTAHMVKKIFKSYAGKSILAYIGALFLLPTLARIKKRIDPRRYNGAMFLGLNGISVKSHGGADALGYFYAIESAINLARNDLCEKIRQGLEDIIFSPDDTFKY